MIEELDAQLTKWVGAVAPGSDVFLGVPAPLAADANPRVGLYLFALAEETPVRTDPMRLREIRARYLVTTWAARPEAEHALLSKLLEAAVIQGRDIEISALPTELWAALRLPPRPHFVLEEAFRIERPEEIAPPVRRPIVVRQVGGITLTGRVLGPQDFPIASAQIAHLGIGSLTTTDATGRFTFPLVPGESVPHRLEVKAKGLRQVFTVEAGSRDPVTLRLQITEG